MVPIVIFGVISVIAGAVIYILLPQALLSQNFGLVLEIFFMILGGLILGLTLLTANLRGFVETIMVYTLFFWERRSMRALLRKNLVAHKHTNKLTSIIYALTLGCVIFLCVALNLVLNSVQNFLPLILPDCDIHVTGGGLTNGLFDSTLQKNADVISDFGYCTVTDSTL